MAIATHRDLDKTREQLRTWLTGRLPDAADITVGQVSMPPGAGFSNETLLADAGWTENGQQVTRELVIRVEPSTHTLYFRAPERFHQQVALLQVLGERTELPVARVRFAEGDPGVLGAPFFAMDRIAGLTVPDLPAYNQQGWLHDATPEQQQDLWWAGIEQLAAIHRTDWRALGLDAHLDPAGTGPQLDYFDAFYDWAREGREYPVIEQTGVWLGEHLPADEPLALCWGDARLANIIYQGFRPAAIIDWDLVAIGNPLADLGWWFLVDEVQFGDRHTGDPADPNGLPGFPSAAGTLTRWSELTGYPGGDIDYYVALAGYKYAICAVRYVSLMTAAGMPPEAAQYADGMRHGAEKVLDRII